MEKIKQEHSSKTGKKTSDQGTSGENNKGASEVSDAGTSHFSKLHAGGGEWGLSDTWTFP